MKQAKRILSLVMAVIMIASAAGLSAFAKGAMQKNWDYTAYRTGVRTDASSYLDGINKVKFSTEQAASYILDMIDDMLAENMEEVMEVGADGDGSWAFDWEVKIDFYLSSIDDAIYTITHLVGLLNDGDKTLLDTLEVKLLGVTSSWRSEAAKWIDRLDVGPLENLNANGISGVYRYSDGKHDRTGSSKSDLYVLNALLTWLYNQQKALVQILSGDSSFSGLTKTILNAIDSDIAYGMTIMEILNNPDQLVDKLIWNLLIDDEDESGPTDSGSVLVNGKTDASTQTVDDGVQQLALWALKDGTGTDAANGSRSLLGEGEEALLPGIADFELYGTVTQNADGTVNQSFDSNGNLTSGSSADNIYSLGFKAIRSLLEGMAHELAVSALLDAFDVDTEANDGKGYTDNDMFSLVVGLVKGFLEDYGAEPLELTGDAATYPVPQIEELVTWLIDNDQISVFLDIKETGISITDNLMALLNKVCRMLPTLAASLDLFEVPEGIAHSASELTATADPIEFNGETITVYETYGNGSKPSKEVYVYSESIDNDILDKESSVWHYLDTDESGNYIDGGLVNTTNKAAADYHNPILIEEKCVYPMSVVYGDIVKIALNAFVDGCYFPSYVDSIAGAAAYALSGLIMNNMPALNLYDRLDAYYYNHNYTEAELQAAYGAPCFVSQVDGNRIGTAEQFKKGECDVVELPWTEVATYGDREVEIPRAAMDIGAALGAYYLNGEWDIKPKNFTYYNNNDPYDLVTFEQFTYEFVLWGLSTFLGTMTGSRADNANLFSNVLGTVNDITAAAGTKVGVWQDLMNSAIKAVYGDTGYTGRTIKSDLLADREKLRDTCEEQFLLVLNKTLFKLIPISWFPDSEDVPIASEGAWGFLYDWLINSVDTLNIQKLFGLFTANPNGELGTTSIFQLLINFIDRVLGIVLGGNALLADSSTQAPSAYSYAVENGLRSGVDSDYNLKLVTTPTRINALSYKSGDNGLLSKNNLAILIGSLLANLYYYGLAAIVTFSPLILDNDSVTEARYSQSNMSIEGLEEYKDELSRRETSWKLTGDNLKIQLTEAKAEFAVKDCGATNLGAVAGEADKFWVQFKEEYSKSERSQAYAAVEYFDNSEVKSYQTVIESGGVKKSTTVYYLQQSQDFMDCADRTTKTLDNGDIVAVYSNFTYATYTDAAEGQKASYDQNEYKFYHNEDFNVNNNGSYKYYARVSDAFDEVEDFIKDYNEFSKETLGEAYGAWMDYSLRFQAYELGFYNSAPSIPNKIYPYYTTNASTYMTLNDGLKTYTGTQPTKNIYFANVNASNYQVIKEALEYGALPENDVVLSKQATQDLVRLATSSSDFQLVAEQDANGNYVIVGKNFKEFFNTADSGATYLSKITAKCDALGYTFHYAGDGGADSYITRPYFRLLSSETNSANYTSVFYLDSVSIVPSNTAITDDEAYTDKLRKEIREDAISYLENVISYEQNIKDYYDYMAWRINTAEQNRLHITDTTRLEWLMRLVEGDLVGEEGKRNVRWSRDDNGDPIYTTVGDEEIVQSEIVWTVDSFQNFSDAYDFSTSLVERSAKNDVNLTQTMVTKAYNRLMETWRALTPKGELYDWSDFDKLLYDKAKPLIDGGNNYILDDKGDATDTLEIEEDSYNTFVKAYNAAILVREALPTDLENYHGTSDQSDFIQGLYNSLNKALNALTFNEAPAIKNTNANNHNTVISSKNADGSDGIYKYIFLGRVGDQFSLNDFRVTGVSGSQLSLIMGSKGYGTGAKLIGTKANGTTAFEYQAIVLGDINGDSKITMTDYVYLLAAKHGVNNVKLNEGQMLASKVTLTEIGRDTSGELIYPEFDENTVIDDADVNFIYNYVMRKNATYNAETGKYDVKCSKVSGTYADDPNYLWELYVKTGAEPNIATYGTVGNQK